LSVSKPPPREWYLLGALKRRENQLAAIVAIVLALAVAGLARVPLRGGFEIDLRTIPILGGARYPSFEGFGPPGPAGRVTHASPARIVMNRPLPERFLLELEGRTLGERVPERVEVRVGNVTQLVAFSAQSRIHSFRVENPGGARTIGLSGAAPLRVVLSRVALR